MKSKLIKLLILFLLLSQFVSMAHAFEHELGHEEESPCFICIHKSQLENTLLAFSVSLLVDESAFEKINEQLKEAYPSHNSLHNNRSPPVNLI